MNKKLIAREWLFLMGGVVAGLLLLNLTQNSIKDDGDAWEASITPYVLFQIVRSIGWAVNTIRAK
ncbi:hypothetical protein [Granulicella sp. L60]|uniref:hypothetical protein n=1 Tax=Granulicella sp. L60 TaxID=1641866 RepID=UPI00131EBF9B|nr:hypothetical protein [Granulicella sp. L60]